MESQPMSSLPLPMEKRCLSFSAFLKYLQKTSASRLNYSNISTFNPIQTSHTNFHHSGTQFGNLAVKIFEDINSQLETQGIGTIMTRRIATHILTAGIIVFTISNIRKHRRTFNRKSRFTTLMNLNQPLKRDCI